MRRRIPSNNQEASFYLFGIVPARYTHREWDMGARSPTPVYWPLLTGMVLHVGFLWALWIPDASVEDRLGEREFLVLYAVTGIAVGVTPGFTNVDSTVVAAGAPGAIAGVTLSSSLWATRIVPRSP